MSGNQKGTAFSKPGNPSVVLLSDSLHNVRILTLDELLYALITNCAIEKMYFIPNASRNVASLQRNKYSTL